MPTFIDESGDTGHARGSAPYFRLAAVHMPSESAAASFRGDIAKLRRQLFLPTDYEFKFVKTHAFPDRRAAFFRVALAHDFAFSVWGVDKTKLHWRTAESAEQHWAVATGLAACLRPIYRALEAVSSPLQEQILVDDNGDRSFLTIVGRAFRGLKSNSVPAMPMTRKPKFRKSHLDEAIQLADMACGATGAFFDGDPTWFDSIESKCCGVHNLP